MTIMCVYQQCQTVKVLPNGPPMAKCHIICYYYGKIDIMARNKISLAVLSMNNSYCLLAEYRPSRTILMKSDITIATNAPCFWTVDTSATMRSARLQGLIYSITANC